MAPVRKISGSYLMVCRLSGGSCIEKWLSMNDEDGWSDDGMRRIAFWADIAEPDVDWIVAHGWMHSLLNYYVVFYGVKPDWSRTCYRKADRTWRKRTFVIQPVFLTKKRKSAFSAIWAYFFCDWGGSRRTPGCWSERGMDMSIAADLLMWMWRNVGLRQLWLFRCLLTFISINAIIRLVTYVGGFHLGGLANTFFILAAPFRLRQPGYTSATFAVTNYLSFDFWPG